MMHGAEVTADFSRRVLPLCLCVALGTTLGCRQEPDYKNPLTPVRTGTVELYQGTSSLRYSANILPYMQIDLAFKSGGYVQSILQVQGMDGRLRNVQEGDMIVKGTVLARIRDEDYIIRVNQAKLQLVQAQSALEAARSQLAEVEVASNLAQLDFSRAKNLFDSQSLTKPDYDAAKARLDSAQDRVATARSQVAALNAQTENVRENIKVAEIPLGDTALKSPIDGQIHKRVIEVGSLVGTGSPAFVIADISLMKAVFGVPDVMMERLKPGAAQKVTTAAVSEDFNGRITAISPLADPRGRTFSVEVTIPNAAGKLKAGMIATLTLTLATAESEGPIPVIPLSAVVRSQSNPNGFAVFLVVSASGKEVAKIHDVELGGTYGNMISVKGGLSREDRLITLGATLVKDGMQVQIIP